MATQGGLDLVTSQTGMHLVKEEPQGAAHQFRLGHALFAVVQLDQANQAGASPVRGVDGEPHQAARQVAQVSVPEVREHGDRLCGQFLPGQGDRWQLRSLLGGSCASW